VPEDPPVAVPLLVLGFVQPAAASNNAKTPPSRTKRELMRMGGSDLVL
jgi:hypothetical protein